MDRAEKKVCGLCSMKPYFNSDGERNMYASPEQLETGAWVTLYACKDKDNRLAIYASAECYTDLYYPDYCPECGKPNKEVPE